MKFHQFHLKNPNRYVILLGLFFLFHGTFAQKTRYIPQNRQRTVINIIDTNRVRKSVVSRDAHVNTTLIYGLRYNSVDTVYDLKPFLAQKAGCDFEKAVDTAGCVIVRYTDGFAKKICNGDVKEVTTADGRKHVLHWMPSTRMYVMELPPPPNPGQADVAYQWLSNYSDSLMADIKVALGNKPGDIQHYSNNELLACKGNLYKQIEYRTIFLEQYLQAK